jgi:SPP1 family phage portal protein
MDKIEKIIKDGADSILSRNEIIESELMTWFDCPQRKLMITGDRYYHGDQDILKRERMVIGEDGELERVNNLPNKKIVDNQYQKMVDQKVNYLFSKPLTFNCDDEKYVNDLKEIFGSYKFQRTLKNLAKDFINCGIGWLYVYINSLNQIAFKKLKPFEILPFWKDDEHTILDFAVRVYNILYYEGHSKKIIRKAEVYTSKGVERYTINGTTLEKDDNKIRNYGYKWNRIPLIAFKANTDEIPLIKKVKCLQDGINELLSDFANNVSEDVRTTVLVLKNYDGENLENFRTKLNTYGVIKVRTVDGSQGGVDTLKIEVNPENYRLILSILQKELIKNASGYDVDELKSGTTPNQMTIKSIYNDIDLDSNEIETEFQASFEEVLEFFNIWKSRGSNSPLEVIVDRDTVVIESQVIADIKNSVGILSKETLVAQHPYVTNVEEELKKIEKEEQSQQEQAMNDYFGNPQKTPEENIDNEK